MGNLAAEQATPATVNPTVRTREYLTQREIDKLMDAARSGSRYGHRDSTMILIAYRHGLRASELCDLQWSQVDFNAGTLRVRRRKQGSPGTHPLQGDEIRALRQGIPRPFLRCRTRKCVAGVDEASPPTLQPRQLKIPFLVLIENLSVPPQIGHGPTRSIRPRSLIPRASMMCSIGTVRARSIISAGRVMASPRRQRRIQRRLSWRQ